MVNLKHKNILKRLESFVSAVFFMVSCSLSPAVTVYASSASSVYSTAELAMALYSLLETAAIAGGIEEGLDDYESGGKLYDAFIDVLRSSSMAGDPDWLRDDMVTFYLNDGSTVSLSDCFGTDGSSALDLPDEDTWSRFRVVEGGGGSVDPGGSGDSGDPDKEPGFDFIKTLKVNGAFLALAGETLKKMFNNGVEGLDRSDYIRSIYSVWSGSYPSGYYVDGYIDIGFDGGFSRCSVLNNYPGPYAFYTFSMQGSVQVEGNDNVGAVYVGAGKIYSASFSVNNDMYKTGASVPYSSYKTSAAYFYDYINYCFDAPLFSSRAAAESYLLNGTEEGLLNGECYDYPELAGSVPEVLAPLAGQNIVPSSVPGVNAALSSAAAALPEPDPAADKSVNNDAYKNAMASALSENMPETLPDPEPDPDPDPGTDESYEQYTVDLTEIFPFCIPFDLIRFLKALDAEPVAPSFEIPFVVEALGIDMSVVFDMSFMDDAVAVFRIGELGCFVIGLMLVTSKVIRW